MKRRLRCVSERDEECEIKKACEALARDAFLVRLGSE